MPTDVRDLLHDAAAAPRRPLDAGLLLGRSRALRRRRAAVATLAVLPVLATVAVLLRVAPPERDIVTAPPPGKIAYERLSDGTRLYVVTADDGTVTALETVSTHVSTAVRKQVGWCARARVFEDPLHGSMWDERGVYLYGPAPADLPRYRLASRDDGRYLVGERIAPARRGSPAASPRAQRCSAGAVGDVPLVLWDGPGGGSDRTHVAVTTLPEGQLARLRGQLVVEPGGGAARVCTDGGTSCLPVSLDEPFTDGEMTGRATLVVRREGNEITEIVYVPGSS